MSDFSLRSAFVSLRQQLADDAHFYNRFADAIADDMTAFMKPAAYNTDRTASQRDPFDSEDEARASYDEAVERYEAFLRGVRRNVVNIYLDRVFDTLDRVAQMAELSRDTNVARAFNTHLAVEIAYLQDKETEALGRVSRPEFVAQRTERVWIRHLTRHVLGMVPAA